MFMPSFRNVIIPHSKAKIYLIIVQYCFISFNLKFINIVEFQKGNMSQRQGKCMSLACGNFGPSQNLKHVKQVIILHVILILKDAKLVDKRPRAMHES